MQTSTQQSKSREIRRTKPDRVLVATTLESTSTVAGPAMDPCTAGVARACHVVRQVRRLQGRQRDRLRDIFAGEHFVALTLAVEFCTTAGGYDLPPVAAEDRVVAVTEGLPQKPNTESRHSRAAAGTGATRGAEREARGSPAPLLTSNTSDCTASKSGVPSVTTSPR